MGKGFKSSGRPNSHGPNTIREGDKVFRLKLKKNPKKPK